MPGFWVCIGLIGVGFLLGWWYGRGRELERQREAREIAAIRAQRLPPPPENDVDLHELRASRRRNAGLKG